MSTKKWLLRASSGWMMIKMAVVSLRITRFFAWGTYHLSVPLCSYFLKAAPMALLLRLCFFGTLLMLFGTLFILFAALFMFFVALLLISVL